MEKRIPVVRVKKIEYNNLVDVDTGELIRSSMSDGDILKVSTPTDSSVVTYDDYAVFSTSSVNALKKILNDADIGKVLFMAITARTPLNIVSTGNRPATNESLREYLGMKSVSMYYRFIKRLTEQNVLYKQKAFVGKRKMTIYLINPYICRKRKVFENRVLNVFRKFDGE